jgi:ABC-type branched-subunit amino acid transport system ATPase component
MSLIDISGLESGYGKLMILNEINLRIEPGELVAIFGPNGSGKSTLAKTIFGELPATDGLIKYKGNELNSKPAESRSSYGMGLIRKNVKKVNESLGIAYEMFPRLRERSNQLAKTLSGGERKMLALASAIVISSDFLLIDEPTSGLAPIIVDSLIEKTLEIANSGITILWIVGDDAIKILPHANRRFLMMYGMIKGEWSNKDPISSKEIAELYFQEN